MAEEGTDKLLEHGGGCKDPRRDGRRHPMGGSHRAGEARPGRGDGRTVVILPDHLEVKVDGASKLNVSLRQVGLLAGVAGSGSRGGESNP